jgi:hypothetical protein
MSNWKSLVTELPEFEKKVLLCNDEGTIKIGTLVNVTEDKTGKHTGFDVELYSAKDLVMDTTMNLSYFKRSFTPVKWMELPI